MDDAPERWFVSAAGTSRSPEGYDRRPDGYLDWSERIAADGGAILSMSFAAWAWIRRRSDTFAATDPHSVSQQTVVDVELADSTLSRAVRRSDRILLPLMTLTAGRDLSVAVTNDAGGTCVQLTRREERSLVAAGLVQSARQELLDAGIAPEVAYEHALSVVDAAPTSTPPAHWPASFEQALSGSARGRLLIAAVPLADGPTTAMTRLTIDVRRPVPVHQWRSTVKSAAADAARRSVDRARRRSPKPAATGGRPTGLARSTFDDFHFRFPVAQITQCDSYHFDFEAPAGTIVSSAVLEWKEIDVDGNVVEEDSVRENDVSADRAHIHKSIPRPREDHYVEAHADVVLRPSTLGTLAGAVFAAVGTAVVLLVLAFTVGWAQAGWRVYVHQPGLASANVEAVTTILLLGPTLLSGFVARRDEHRMARTVTSRVRNRVLLNGCCSFTAAATIASGATGAAPSLLLVALAALASVTAAITVVSAGASKRAENAATTPST